MRRYWVLGLLSIILALNGMAFTRQNSSAPNAETASASDANPPPGPDRFTVLTVEYQAYEWTMATWRYKKPVCTLIVDHEGMPVPGEVYRDCGKDIYEDWIVQDPCVEKDKRTCEGYYVFKSDSYLEEKEVPMELEPATAWVSLEDCEPVASVSTNVCEGKPTLVITGQEPLQDESITRIEGKYNGEPFDCGGTYCKFQIVETGPEGVPVEFWSYSTYGDSSVVYTAQVRVKKVDEGDPDQLYWYVDILSSQWMGQSVATCADSWNVFPPVGGPPEWLTTPKQSEELSSDIPYTYLAANLIKQGVADASACPDGGVSPGGGANQCGLEAARPAIIEWQNQFDGLILSTAEENAIPARLLKNLFARESQFWPGLYQGAVDVGLGQLTENGADTTLFWNDSFFEQFCPMIYPEDTCGNGYMGLDEEQQIGLRQALVRSVNATCEDCPLGIDLARAEFSVVVFAHTMTANCKQTGQVLENYTGESPGEVAAYEDLWKFTLVNYNAGGGCLAEGITRALGEGLELTWDNVSPFFSGACSSAVDYVNDISK
ncbi:hypothetical protein ANAEL_02523 [Anaerolineales bacterium]|nr:hypothetical protein ANAEL_02523 [Anaerolineales bacterium]